MILSKRIFSPAARLYLLLVLYCVSVQVRAQTVSTLLLPSDRLAALKKTKDKTGTTAKAKIVASAEQYLAIKPVSVMDKVFTPVSGSKHDYMSQAPYFWYDSSKPNGLPYLRRDGQRNPEINKITDRKNIGDLENATTALALAWYFTGKKAYAEKAATLLRTWFMDTSTRMNPNLDYGQGIPGINTGRGIGIIETIALMGIADATLVLERSGAWTKTDRQSMKEWYGQYLQWMQASANGKEEHAAKNNHGSWYYAQALDFALYTGDLVKARNLVEESKQLMEGQFDAEGKQLLELERTNALWYSTYNLQAWLKLAMLAEKTGIDLWQQVNSKGAGIRKAIDWLMPYAIGEKSFPYQQMDGYNKQVFYEILAQADKHYPEADHYKVARSKAVINTLPGVIWNY
jgi:hypothetical protein